MDKLPTSTGYPDSPTAKNAMGQHHPFGVTVTSSRASNFEPAHEHSECQEARKKAFGEVPKTRSPANFSTRISNPVV